MDSRQFIDAQFDRAVQIIQSFPKTGPIQTGYEEKLAMYSLYKQATVGNVQGPRPPIWDMLGRSKWDAWAKHKDLEQYEAKWLYIDALLRVLRKYSDKTVARDMIKEIEAIGGNRLNSSYSRSHDSDSDSTSPSIRTVPTPIRTSLQLHSVQQQQLQQQLQRAAATHDPTTSEEEAADAEEETDDEDKENVLPSSVRTFHTAHQSLAPRPMSSMSTSRYRTPASLAAVVSPPLTQSQLFISPHSTSGQPPNIMSLSSHSAQTNPYVHVPAVQPTASFDTPSAFAGPSAASSTTGLGSSYAHGFSSNMYSSPRNSYINQQLQSTSQQQPLSNAATVPTEALSPLERAVASVQAHLAALQERIESLESVISSSSNSQLRPLRWSLPAARKAGDSFNQSSRRLSPHYGPGSPTPWSFWDWHLDSDWETEIDFAHMGMWSTILTPLARLFRFLIRSLRFVLHRDAATTPTRAVVRRLLLDVSFILCAISITKYAWRKSGVRRREVVWALRALWTAVIGSDVGPPKVLVEKGV